MTDLQKIDLILDIKNIPQANQEWEPSTLAEQACKEIRQLIKELRSKS
jgi:hypothetical protein